VIPAPPSFVINSLDGLEEMIVPGVSTCMPVSGGPEEGEAMTGGVSPMVAKFSLSLLAVVSLI